MTADGRTVLERWADFRDAWGWDNNDGPWGVVPGSVEWSIDGYRPIDEYQKQAPRLESAGNHKSTKPQLSPEHAILKMKWDNILRSK